MISKYNSSSHVSLTFSRTKPNIFPVYQLLISTRYTIRQVVRLPIADVGGGGKGIDIGFVDNASRQLQYNCESEAICQNIEFSSSIYLWAS